MPKKKPIRRVAKLWFATEGERSAFISGLRFMELNETFVSVLATLDPKGGHDVIVYYDQN